MAWRGLLVTLSGSALALVSAAIESVTSLASSAVALVAQVTPTPSSVGIIGLFAGLITAVGGIALQAYDRANARRRAELDHEYRLELARHGYDELCDYSRSAYAYMCAVRDLCKDAKIELPPGPGPPPLPPPCRPDHSHDSSAGDPGSFPTRTTEAV